MREPLFTHRICALFCAALPFLAAAAYWQLAALHPRLAWTEPGPWLTSTAFAIAALALLTDQLALRRFANPRIRLASTAALSFSLVLLPLTLARALEHRADEATRAQISAWQRQARVANARRLAAERAALREAALARQPDRFSQYQGDVPFVVLEAIREVDARMHDQLQARQQAYQAGLQEFPTSGPADWVVFRTAEQLERELHAHTQLYALSRDLLQFIENFFDEYERQLEPLDLSPVARRIAVAELQRIRLTWDQAQLLTVRRLDTEALSAALDALRLLQVHWGAWEYNPRERSLRFTNEAANIGFENAVLALQAIAAELQSIRDQAEKSRSQ